MTPQDIACAVLLALALVAIAAVMIAQAYRRANPKPRGIFGPGTTVRRGRVG